MFDAKLTRRRILAGSVQAVAGLAGAGAVASAWKALAASSARGLRPPRIGSTSPPMPTYITRIAGPVEFGPQFGLPFQPEHFVVFESHAVATQAWLAGTVDVIVGSTDSMMAVAGQGRDLKIFLPDYMVDDLVLAVSDKISGPNDLLRPDVRVAIDSRGGAAYAALDALLAKLAPGLRIGQIPNLVILESSGLRETALANGDVDASVIHIDQFERVNRARGGRFRSLGRLYEDVPMFQRGAWAATSRWLESNMEVATALAAAVLTCNRTLMRDFDHYVRSVRRFVRGGGPPEDQLRSVWTLIRRYPFWPVNDDDFDPRRFEFMMNLAVSEGTLSRPLDVNSVLDRRPITAAIQRIGKVSRSEFA